MTTMQMVYKFVQTDAHIHQHCQETHNNKVLPVVNCGTHGNHCGRLYMSPRVYCHNYVQVNEKSCRLRMGAYRDGVKSKGDKIGMGV